MENRIKEIYSTVIQGKEYMDGTGKEAEEKIMALLNDEAQQMERQEYERYRDKIFQAAAIAEEAGFITGFKYAAVLMAECFARDDIISTL